MFSTELDVPEFGAYILRIVICSWLIVSLIRMKCSTLSLLINFAMKPILLEIRTVMPACRMVAFA